MNTKLGKNTCVSCCLFLFSMLFFAYQKQGVLEFQEIKQATGGLKSTWRLLLWHVTQQRVAWTSEASRWRQLRLVWTVGDVFRSSNFGNNENMTHQKTKWWDLYQHHFYMSVGQNVHFFSVGQIKKRGVTLLGLSVFGIPSYSGWYKTP